MQQRTEEETLALLHKYRRELEAMAGVILGGKKYEEYKENWKKIKGE